MPCPTPSCLPSARNTLFHTFTTGQYHIITIWSRCRVKRHNSETDFIVKICLFMAVGALSRRAYVFGVCTSLKLGFRILESYLSTATSGRGLGFFSWYDYGACWICIYLWNCSIAATGERKALQWSVWTWLADSKRFVNSDMQLRMFNFRTFTANNEH